MGNKRYSTKSQKQAAKQVKRLLKKLPPKMRKVATVLGTILLILFAVWYYWPEIETMLTPDIPAAADPVPVTEGNAEVYFFDVGQGDSILIRVDDYTMLIDASVREAGDTIVQNLDELGVTELDAVIATHPHADHIGGMTQIIETYPIETFYMPILPEEDTPTTRTYENMLDALDEQRVTVKQISDETQIAAPDGAVFEVYSPYVGDEWDETNDYSVVFRFSYGDVSFMLTGDAEAPVEERMLETNWDISADILKCGHHGSSSSTTEDFLYAVDPEVAIISCAEVNDYGHPHRETMAALREHGCDIMQTWQDGTVCIVTDGETYTVNTWSVGAGLQPAA